MSHLNNKLPATDFMYNPTVCERKGWWDLSFTANTPLIKGHPACKTHDSMQVLFISDVYQFPFNVVIKSKIQGPRLNALGNKGEEKLKWIKLGNLSRQPTECRMPVWHFIQLGLLKFISQADELFQLKSTAAELDKFLSKQVTSLHLVWQNT